jgi:general stress protein YciG
MDGQRKRGFAAMSPEKQREIARKGGQAAHSKGTAHEFSSEEACRAGHIGGKVVSANRAHMAAIGRKGGLRSVQRAAATRAQKQSTLTPLTPGRVIPQENTSLSVPDLLRRDHRRINGLFHQYEYGEQTPDAHAAVLKQICDELLSHTAFEEEKVYPIVRQAFSESEQEAVDRSIRAHERIKDLVRHIAARAVADESLAVVVHDLQSCVRQHVQEEELTILAKVEERAGPALQRLAADDAPVTPDEPRPPNAGQHGKPTPQDSQSVENPSAATAANGDLPGAPPPLQQEESFSQDDAQEFPAEAKIPTRE